MPIPKSREIKKARQINGLINEWYLEDLSENIRADETIGCEQFESLNQTYLKERDDMLGRLQNLTARLAELMMRHTGQEQIRLLERCLQLSVLTQKLAVYFIHQVKIGACDAATGEQPLKISWSF